MKKVSLPGFQIKNTNLFSLFLLATLLLSLALAVPAQTQKPSLSLADILIALRSKKVTLDERNKILADAVKERGITFAISKEIEKELIGTGANLELVEAIRQKSPVVKVAATPVPTPVATPAPPDFSFYQKRADSLNARGDYDLAINDYNRAAELNPKEASIYISRGLIFFNKKNYDLAVSDYDKVIELNPKDAKAFFNRGSSYEKLGNTSKALADYQKAVELDAGNEAAKTNLKRIQDERARALAEQKKQETVPVAEKPKTPEIVELGQLTTASAIRMVKPFYSLMAQKSNAQGQVTVEVKLDEEGNVVSAKATVGHVVLRAACEDAALKSKFKPATINGQNVKAAGFIVYNFTK